MNSTVARSLGGRERDLSHAHHCTQWRASTASTVGRNSGNIVRNRLRFRDAAVVLAAGGKKVPSRKNSGVEGSERVRGFVRTGRCTARVGAALGGGHDPRTTAIFVLKCEGRWRIYRLDVVCMTDGEDATLAFRSPYQLTWNLAIVTVVGQETERSQKWAEV